MSPPCLHKSLTTWNGGSTSAPWQCLSLKAFHQASASWNGGSTNAPWQCLSLKAFYQASASWNGGSTNASWQCLSLKAFHQAFASSSPALAISLSHMEMAGSANMDAKALKNQQLKEHQRFSQWLKYNQQKSGGQNKAQVSQLADMYHNLTSTQERKAFISKWIRNGGAKGDIGILVRQSIDLKDESSSKISAGFVTPGVIATRRPSHHLMSQPWKVQIFGQASSTTPSWGLRTSLRPGVPSRVSRGLEN